MDRDIGNGSGNEAGISGLGLILVFRVRILGRREIGGL